MFNTWDEIFPGFGEPVHGTVASYQAATSECDDLKAVTEACAAEFDSVGSSESLGELGGQAADQLITLISAVDVSFQHVPPVFTSLVAIFDAHAQQLSALRQEAVAALALATTRWNVLQQSEAASVRASDTLRRINNQIRNLERASGEDPGLQTQLDDLYGNRAWYQADATSCSMAVVEAEIELGWSRSAHTSLVSAEHDLLEHTVSSLEGVDLDDLRDPSRLGQIVSNVGGYIADLATDIVIGVAQLVEALVSNDWAGVLWRLSDLLGSVLEVVTVISLVVAVMASGGLLLTVVSLGLALMTVKLAVDVVLTGGQLPHPDTGHPMTWHQLAVQAAVYAFTVATAGAGGVGGKVLGQSAPSPSAARSFAANLRTVLAPVSTSSGTRGGTRLHLAAVAQSVATSGRRVAEFAIDDVIIPQTQGQVESSLNGLMNDLMKADRLTTEPSAWANPTLVGFMRDSQVTRDGLRRINAATQSLRVLAGSGPSFRPNAPAYHLSGAQ